MQVKGNQYIYADISGLSDLKAQARNNQQAAIREVAKQFESLFMNMMLKSMRDASMGDPIFDSNQSMVYRDMFDRQLALSLSRDKGMGLAEVLARQLTHQVTGQPNEPPGEAGKGNMIRASYQEPGLFPANVNQRRTTAPAPQTVHRPAPVDPIGKIDLSADLSSPQEKFIRELWPMAEAAAGELDTLPEVLIAQAALETGWGKHISKAKDGQSSFNLFNIKAGGNWDGKTIGKTTVEFHNGVPVKEVARFRAYDSYADSFRDYVDFLKSSERYRPALQNASDPEKFIRGLHRAGYATDPDYADKILNIIDREWDVINRTIALYEGLDINV